jgi:hypothetical protein
MLTGEMPVGRPVLLSCIAIRAAVKHRGRIQPGRSMKVSEKHFMECMAHGCDCECIDGQPKPYKKFWLLAKIEQVIEELKSCFTSLLDSH